MDFWYFQTASDDASAMPVKDIILIDASSAAVTVYFSAGAGNFLQSVALTVTAGQEEAVVQALCGFASSRIGYGRMIIGDDANSVYCHSGITAVGTITTDVAVAA